MPRRAWETLLRDVVQGLRPPYTPESVRPWLQISKHGPWAPPRPGHYPTTRPRERYRAKGRPAAKGRGKAQGDGNTPTGTGAPGATHHRSKERTGGHRHRERERARATTLGKGEATRTVARANTHGEGTRRVGRTNTAPPFRTESTRASLPRGTHREAPMGHHHTRAQAPKAHHPKGARPPERAIAAETRQHRSRTLARPATTSPSTG